jgi:hypothetical protein
LRQVLIVAAVEALLEDAFCAGVAFAATRCNAKIMPQFGHGRRALIHSLTNFTFGNVIANANYHGGPV